MLSRKGSAKQQKQDKFIQEPIQTVDGQIRIKKYLLIKIVGSGSYSKCHLVKNTDSDSTYVVKVIPKKKLQILQKEKLVYQIKIHQSLSHQNVVHLDHWFEDDNNQYIFMEYCPNGNLETKLTQSNGSMSQSQIKRYGLQIVNAISYIHSQNILHRDLKLCNFYLDQNNNVKLGDFGFACQLASEYDRKRETCGTPNYIAPEAISGFGYSFSSDVWAIGVILYRLKYGCCPFQGQSVKKTLENVKLCNYKFPSKSKISPQLKDLIQKIFQLNYDDRLTTHQILQHKFFQQQDISDINCSPSRELKQQKRGFSLSKLFSIERNKSSNQKVSEKKTKQTSQGNRNRQGVMDRQSRNPTVSVSKKQEPKRSNSCQTFKQIKQIFKNKKKTNQTTLANSNSKKQSLNSAYFTMNTLTSGNNREKEAPVGSKTNRTSINEYTSIGINQTLDNTLNNYIGKQKEVNTSRSNRVSQFVRSHVNSIPLKEQLKMNKLNSSKNSINVGETASKNIASKNQQKEAVQNIQPPNNYNYMNVFAQRNAQNGSKPNSNYINGVQKIVKMGSTPHNQQLFNYSRKYYLPTLIQQEKDVIIIHYKPTVKHIIYANVGYIVHRSIQNLYRMTGDLVITSQLPKVLKYILQNKVDVKQYETNCDQYEFGENNINKILQYVPHTWVQLKDGIILKYGSHGNALVAKLHSQEGFYIQDDISQPIMYNIGPDCKPRVFQGVIIMRIYSGWVKTYCKK